jgi:hypothetical protein
VNPLLFPDDVNPLLAAGDYINEAAGRRRGEREARNERIGNALLQSWPVEMGRVALDAMALPGDVYAGRVDPMSDEGIGRAAELTGILALQAPIASRQGTVGIFGGRGARTADLDALARAQQMADAGADRREVWDATGWFKGPDGQWRFEIDDSGASLTGQSGRMGDAVSHPELYAAYPDVADQSVDMGADLPRRLLAARDPQTGDLFVSRSNPDPMSSVIHETQHAVQSVEGYPAGAMPNSPGVRAIASEGIVRAAQDAQAQIDAIREASRKYGTQTARSMGDPMSAPDHARDYLQRPEVLGEIERLQGIVERSRSPRALQSAQENVYTRLLGEVEARNAQRRLPMSAGERRATPPWDTQDVADEAQIAYPRPR